LQKAIQTPKEIPSNTNSNSNSDFSLSGPTHRRADALSSQETNTVSTASLPTSDFLNFDGIGATPFIFPPDPNSAVGLTQIVEVVNVVWSVFEKATGALLTDYPKPLNSLFEGFFGSLGADTCRIGYYTSDPIVSFDQLANRWVFSFIAIDEIGAIFGTHPVFVCVAISQVRKYFFFIIHLISQ
jgi:hypothetical protein